MINIHFQALNQVSSLYDVCSNAIIICKENPSQALNSLEAEPRDAIFDERMA